MGKLNEIQEQVTQSFGNNSFTTKITDTTVEFDSARDSFTFKDEVSVPSMKINGTESQPFTTEEKTKLSQVTTPMNIKGRVDSASELPTEDVRVGDVYLVGESGSETFEEYVCTEISGSPEQPVWENLGHVKSQPDWNQNNSNAEDFIKNRVCYEDNNETIFDSETLSGCEVKGNVSDDEISIVDGAQYTVTIDGITYTGIGEDGDSIVYRGDDQSFVIVPGTLSYFTKFVGIPINSFTPSITIKDSNQTTLFSGVGSFRQEAVFGLNYTEYLTDGQSYTISLNGNEYIGTASYGGAAIEIDGVLALYLDSGELILIGNTAVPYLNTNVQFVLKQVTSTIHQLDEKFIPDTIARTADIPEAAFNIDKTKYNIYPTFTNQTNEIKSTLGSSLIACAPAASNCVFDGGTNVFLGSAVYRNKISGSSNIGISSNSNLDVSGSGNIALNSNGSQNKISGSSNIMMTSGAAAVTFGGNSNTIISSYGGSCTISDSEYGSVLIGNCSAIKLQNGGFQKLCLNAQAGSELNSDHSTIICGGGKLYGPNSSIISAHNTGNNVYGANSLIIGGGQTGTVNIGTSSTSASMCNAICSGNGPITITQGEGNNVIGSCGGMFAVNGGTNNNILCFNGSGTIQGNQYNMILGGSGSVTIPGTVTNCIVIGAATSSPTESNMVYVPALNAVNGVKTKKMTIAGIDPADCFMHSEIIDASSDVSFSRTIASASSSKTDGYVEILYKVSSGVTCSAYINSTDVALTADGDWHKLERGCNPADGVEIHINNPSPVTDATMEVISKVYYI